MLLNENISCIKGVGKKYSEAFYKKGINSVEDLIMYFPRDYEYIGTISRKDIFKGIVSSIKKDTYTRNGLVITTIELVNEENYKAKLVYFNRPYMKQNFILGKECEVYGTVKNRATFVEIHNAEIVKHITKNNIIPKYSSIKGIGNTFLIKIITNVIKSIKIEEILPNEIINRRNLMSLNDAIFNIHLPENKKSLGRAIERFKYQELLYYFIKTRLFKKKVNSKNIGIKYKIYTDELIALKESLKFTLTNDQNNAIKQILLEQKTDYSINRLLQGDVGSGKTIVAFITMFNVIMNGYKACLIVPTEILATQHYKDALELFEKFNINIKLLVGGLKEKEKKILKEELKKEEPMIIIGTHAVLEDDVEITKLGYVIFDEQHRFGVSQRSKLIHKSDTNCDVLVMTATPIPRTLFLYIYNDMDISVIKELPSNRKKVNTVHLKQENKNELYNLIKREIENGGQCYVVCPLIEESEKLKLNSVETIEQEFKQSILGKYNIKVLHGKLDNKSKNEIMSNFKDGNVDILISTTVIEVGISVANATIIVVINAERFGLSQIHQLRGRVGRGSKEGTCILVTSSMNDITKKRISTLIESNDGFYLSEQDLKIRGCGDIFGLNQHGDMGFIFADLLNDIDILRNVKEDIDYMDELDTLEIKVFYKKVQSKLDNIDKTICFN